MQCLYCKKKLGLFASKKRPFCSEQHEVAYNDEQAGLAMRRVMDPLFTEPSAKVPLQPPKPVVSSLEQPQPAITAGEQTLELPAPPQAPPSAPPKESVQPVSEKSASAPATPSKPPASAKPTKSPASAKPAVAPREAVGKAPAPAVPAKPTFEPVKPPPLYEKIFQQPKPVPFPPDWDEALAAFGFAQTPGETRLPTSDAGLVGEGPIREEQVAQQAAIPPTPPAEPVIEAQPQAGPEATRLHPALPQERPAWFGEGEEPPKLFQGPTFALDFEAERALNPASGLTIAPGPLQAGAMREETAPAPLAERVDSRALDPQAAAAPHLPRRHVETPLDTPELALRYPFANLGPVHSAIGAKSVGEGSSPRARVRWNLAGPAGRTPELELLTTALEALPPELLWSGRSGFALNAPRAALEPRGSAAVAPTRWKVLSGLRESPAKLRQPQPRREAAPRLGDARAHKSNWADPVAPLAVVHATPETQAWLSEPTTPVWDADLVTKLGTSGSSRLSWTGPAPMPERVALEGMRQMHQVRNPGIPEPEGLSVMTASLIELDRNLQTDRRQRYRPSGLVGDTGGIQRVRPASFIQIREPELYRSNPSDLPTASPRLKWGGIRPIRDQRAHGSALPLRPELRNPNPGA